MQGILKKLVVASALVGAFAAANATPIVGIANFSTGAVLVTLGNIDWNPNINPPPNLVPTFGDFSTLGFVSTGSFAPANMTGDIHDMSQNPFDANYVPIGASVGVANFFKFDAQPNWLFTETSLAAGLFGSPYALTQQGNNVFASITVNGTACDAGASGIATVCDGTDEITEWTAALSAQFVNTTILAISNDLQGICGPNPVSAACDGMLNNNSWSGTLEARAIPEPGTVALLGLGLLGVAATRRRRAK